ncbi:MarR family winged helix-turn-helix transcriptional regulator [Streptomyces sp. NPDC020917]|uniref:MarR family winged helix-turn-helix transcriptional regulator n=1 Tax=Streptomyces sp. NPDC020917 TaxID=3365102 RepID=UPI0037A16BF7
MPDETQARIADELTTVIAQLTRRLRAASAQEELTPSQTSVLSRLSREGPATTAGLARSELVRPQSMRMTLAALEERGLVARTPDPSDGRQVVFTLTETGVRLHGTGRRNRRSWLADAIEDELSPAEQRLLTEAVPLLQRLVSW